MHRSPFRRFIAPLARRCRFRRPGLGTAIFGARLLIAFALPSHVLAHDAHPAAQPAAAVLDEAPFLKENDAAMNKMMDDMAIKPTGDVDRDFVAMMAPHHQGAIDMAHERAALRQERAASAARPGDHRRPDARDRRHEARDRQAGNGFSAVADATATGPTAVATSPPLRHAIWTCQRE